MIREFEFRTPYNYDTDKVSEETGLDCSVGEVYDEDLKIWIVKETPSLAVQDAKDECDINTIVKRFGLTGEMPDNPRVPVSGDFRGIGSYQDALNAVIAADEAFMELPALVREQFANDPQKLMDFVADGNNREKAIELGLVPKPVEKPRDVVQAVDELSAKLVPPASK